MRFAWIVVVAFVTMIATKAVAQAEDLFRTLRPDLIIGISRDPNGSGADLLEFRTIDPKYPPEQLRDQILELGKLMNSEPRGLVVARSSISSGMSTIKATCAIDNIIDRSQPRYHLKQIAQAFAGYAEPHAVKGLSIQFLNEKPRKETLLDFGGPNDAVQVQGSFDPTFSAVEYRIKINIQDAKQIEIPEAGEQKPIPAPSSDAKGGPDWMVWGLVFIAAIAVGALVYSLLTNTKVQKGRKR